MNVPYTIAGIVTQDQPASIQGYLSPRDEAGLALLVILTLGFIILAWRSPKVSEASKHLWRCILDKRIVAVFSTQIALGLLSGWLLRQVLSPLLNTGFSYWKTTVEWLLLTAFPAVAFAIQANHKQKFLRKWFKANVSATLLIVFILSQHTFGFVVEFVLLLCITFLSILIAVASEPERKPTKVALEYCAWPDRVSNDRKIDHGIHG